MKGKYLAKNREFLELVIPLDLVVRKLLIPFLFVVACASFYYGVGYPIAVLSVLLLIFILVSGGAFYIMDRGWLPGDLTYFTLLACDCVLVAVSIYYTGGMESFMPMIYGIIGVLAGLTLPLWGILGIITVAGTAYFVELALEVYRIIPHFTVFKEFIPAENYLRSAYVRIIPLANFALSIAVTFMAFSVADILRKRKEKLAELNAELDLSAKLLVRRDLELNEVNQTLENKVKERTRELQDKVTELKEFHDLAVGRELKMIELEKEIEKLKKGG